MMLFSSTGCQNKSSTIPTKKQLSSAEKYFNELQEKLESDNGKLWGIELYGPTMFVFPESHTIIANQQSKNNTLTKSGNVFYGILPENFNVANTALIYDGEKWATVTWGNFFSDKERNILLIHESWHRIQDEIRLHACMSENQHLDSGNGSLLLKLEFMALDKAVLALANGKSDIMIDDLRDAIVIRNKRQQLNPQNNENQFECHEGLAEYTALKLMATDTSSMTEMVVRMSKKLEAGLEDEGFTNSFAYLTGPVYGFILDAISPDWKKEVLSGKTIIDVVKENVDISENVDLDEEIKKIIVKYNAEDFVKNEESKINSKAAAEAQLIDKFRNCDILMILNNNINFSFNPNEKVISYDTVGMIYKTMKLSGDFGSIEATDGIMINKDWAYFILPYSDKNAGKNGFKMELNKGYEITNISNNKYSIIKSER